jgi:hypothetical protein
MEQGARGVNLLLMSAGLEQILVWTCICKAVVFKQWNF